MSHAAIEAFFDACRLPDTKPGQRVRLLRFSNSAVKSCTNEVRGADGLFPFGYFFGSKKQCLQFMADKQLDCVNLAEWGESLPPAELLQTTA